MDNIEVQHLSQTQTQLLLAVYLAGTPEEAREIARRNSDNAAAAKTLIRMDLLVVGTTGAAVTKAGIEELKTSGYIDTDGQTTEFGQSFYQKAAPALSEKYQLINKLLSN